MRKATEFHWLRQHHSNRTGNDVDDVRDRNIHAAAFLFAVSYSSSPSQQSGLCNPESVTIGKLKSSETIRELADIPRRSVRVLRTGPRFPKPMLMVNTVMVTFYKSIDRYTEQNARMNNRISRRTELVNSKQVVVLRTNLGKHSAIY